MRDIEQEIKDLDVRRAELETRRAELVDEMKGLSKLAPEQQIAIMLHEKLCHWNHIDGCGWHYEVKKDGHDWNGYAHADYLKKAKNWCANFSPDADIVSFSRKLIEAL